MNGPSLTRACLAAALIATSLPLLAGCVIAGAASTVVYAPVVATVDAVALSVLPDFPREVVELQGESLAEVHDGARYGSAWYELEYARRLEQGVGIARDPVCAYVIYRRNRDANNSLRAGDKGMIRLEKDPTVADFLGSGGRKGIGECIPGHMMAGFEVSQLGRATTQRPGKG